MDSLQSVSNCIRPNCRMASVDLKDAFYRVSIHQTIKSFSILNGKSTAIHLGHCRVDIIRP